MQYVNINTNQVLQNRPKSIRHNNNLVISPSDDILKEAGWYPIGSRDNTQITRQLVVIGRTWSIDDNGFAHETIVTTLRKVDEKLKETARIFRDILRIHFGENAETNTEVTENAVTQYFLNKRLTGNMEPTDTMDSMLLLEGFKSIRSWTGDGTIWSFPWEILDTTTTEEP